VDETVRIALIGCGAIGKVILQAILAHQIRGAEMAVVAEVQPSENLVKELSEEKVPLVADPAVVLDSSPDLMIEAAGQEAVRIYAPLFLKAGKDAMILSIGALADAFFLGELKELAVRQGARIIVPSGAIGGLDAIKSANFGTIHEVVIRNIKPPEALEGAPFVVKNNIDLKSMSKPTQIFEGFADDAAREFPKNMNVTVALGLAGIGPERTRVIIIVDPKETRNIHEISATGDFGEGTFTVAGLPSPDNPKTSYLASLSALATLQNLMEPLQVGT
jgi:aspartate dehydrogenase